MGGVSMEWKLKDLTVDGKGSYGIGAPAVPYQEDKLTYLRITDINDDGSLNFSDLKSVDAEDAEKYILKENDIVFARTGNSTGRSYFYEKQHGTFVYAGFLIKFSLDPNKVNPRILKYYTHSKPYFDWVNSFDTGATRGNINAKTYGDMEIELPSRKVQDKIVSILSSLDQKIELNNKINADLEEMAQAIFKNWFVDFEPFKDGKFVDSELGMIPEGWKVGTLGELCNFKRGKNLLTKNAIDEGVPVVAGGLEPSCYHNVANTGAPVITVSGSGANAGFMRMYHVPVWASDCSFIDISCENFFFVYCFLKVNSKLLKHAQTGAVQPHVKPSDIHDFELVIPDKESIYDFQDKVKPFFDKIAAIQKENSRLSLLRDTLLPRLMSGELEVPE